MDQGHLRPRHKGGKLMSVLDEIGEERRRQIIEEGFDAEHDDAELNGALSDAAAVYCVTSSMTSMEILAHRKFLREPGDRLAGFASAATCWWPENWDPSWFKAQGGRRDLIKAGALIVAEIERLDRIAAREAEAYNEAQEELPETETTAPKRPPWWARIARFIVALSIASSALWIMATAISYIRPWIMSLLHP